MSNPATGTPPPWRIRCRQCTSRARYYQKRISVLEGRLSCALDILHPLLDACAGVRTSPAEAVKNASAQFEKLLDHLAEDGWFERGAVYSGESPPVEESRGAATPAHRPGKRRKVEEPVLVDDDGCGAVRDRTAEKRGVSAAGIVGEDARGLTPPPTASKEQPSSVRLSRGSPAHADRTKSEERNMGTVKEKKLAAASSLLPQRDVPPANDREQLKSFDTLYQMLHHIAFSGNLKQEFNPGQESPWQQYWKGVRDEFRTGYFTWESEISNGNCRERLITWLGAYMDSDAGKRDLPNLGTPPWTVDTEEYRSLRWLFIRVHNVYLNYPRKKHDAAPGGPAVVPPASAVSPVSPAAPSEQQHKRRRSREASQIANVKLHQYSIATAEYRASDEGKAAAAATRREIDDASEEDESRPPDGIASDDTSSSSGSVRSTSTDRDEIGVEEDVDVDVEVPLAAESNEVDAAPSGSAARINMPGPSLTPSKSVDKMKITTKPLTEYFRLDSSRTPDRHCDTDRSLPRQNDHPPAAPNGFGTPNPPCPPLSQATPSSQATPLPRDSSAATTPSAPPAPNVTQTLNPAYNAAAEDTIRTRPTTSGLRLPGTADTRFAQPGPPSRSTRSLSPQRPSTTGSESSAHKRPPPSPSPSRSVASTPTDTLQPPPKRHKPQDLAPPRPAASSAARPGVLLDTETLTAPQHRQTPAAHSTSRDDRTALPAATRVKPQGGEAKSTTTTIPSASGRSSPHDEDSTRTLTSARTEPAQLKRKLTGKPVADVRKPPAPGSSKLARDREGAPAQGVGLGQRQEMAAPAPRAKAVQKTVAQPPDVVVKREPVEPKPPTVTSGSTNGAVKSEPLRKPGKRVLRANPRPVPSQPASTAGPVKGVPPARPQTQQRDEVKRAENGRNGAGTNRPMQPRPSAQAQAEAMKGVNGRSGPVGRSNRKDGSLPAGGLDDGLRYGDTSSGEDSTEY
ncbi:hypothetical protein HDU96_010218 [Phlyctochytrium bullatum]|nr:hypothetical protein HDU96_010218 [Phlyctochytrium bullatum]